jgi:1-acyl-sn-glycerol-3-phosphate acyltransferase
MSTYPATLEPQLAGEPETTFVTRFRQIARILGFLGLTLISATELVVIHLRGQGHLPRLRAQWLQRLCRRILALLNIRADYIGEAAEDGLFVFNHVSYVDILVLSARHPVVFVAKKEVESWPLFGWLASVGGTIFIDRTKRGDVARIAASMEQYLEQGVRVCIFPEGTSSDGSKVLPFRTSLLEPAVARDYRVTAGWVGYKLEDGDPATEVCYWGDLSFGPHILNLFGKRGVHATAVYADAGRAENCRKEFGRRLHAIVSGLAKH